MKVILEILGFIVGIFLIIFALELVFGIDIKWELMVDKMASALGDLFS